MNSAGEFLQLMIIKIIYIWLMLRKGGVLLYMLLEGFFIVIF